jgi:hypothetical protein
VRLERLGNLKKSTSFGTRTGDLPACSIVPQPTTLPRAYLRDKFTFYLTCASGKGWDQTQLTVSFLQDYNRIKLFRMVRSGQVNEKRHPLPFKSDFSNNYFTLNHFCQCTYVHGVTFDCGWFHGIPIFIAEI